MVKLGRKLANSFLVIFIYFAFSTSCYGCIKALGSSEESLSKNEISYQKKIWNLRAKGEYHSANNLERSLESNLREAKVLNSERLSGGHGASSNQGKPYKLAIEVKDFGEMNAVFKFDHLEWRREVTAYRLARLFSLPAFEVPITVPYKYKGRTGSLQIFIDNAMPVKSSKHWQDYSFVTTKETGGFLKLYSIGGKKIVDTSKFPEWEAMQIFDFIIGNGDRHKDNFFFMLNNNERYIAGIDHGFAVQTDGKNHWRIRPRPTYNSSALKDFLKALREVNENQIFDALDLFNGTRKRLSRHMNRRRKQLIKEIEFHLLNSKTELHNELSVGQLDPELSTHLAIKNGRDGTEESNRKILIDILDGEYVGFRNIDLRGIQSITFRVASGELGGTIYVHTDTRDGTKIGEARIYNTGGWHNWVDVTIPIKNIEKNTDLHLIFSDRFYSHPHEKRKIMFDLLWVRLNR